MIAAHTLLAPAAGEDRPWWHWLASGRASALFAVLAGVSLALMSGGATAMRGRERSATVVALVVRALLIATIGLALGALDSGLAVILAYYGLLFLLGVPFLALGPRTLLVLAGGWALVAPVLSHLVRPSLPQRGFASPSFEQLDLAPGDLLAELLLTGYYPAVVWLAYLLVGMAAGRLALRRRAVQAWLAGVGTVLAVGAQLLAEALPPAENARDYYGTTPTDEGWRVLLVADPHSGTTLDLVTTTGSALAVIGGCLLVLGALPALAERAVAVVFGAGAMSLTLYSLHVLLRTPGLWPEDHGVTAFERHALVVLVVGAAFALLRTRGPLEAAVRVLSRAATRSLRPVR